LKTTSLLGFKLLLKKQAGDDGMVTAALGGLAGCGLGVVVGPGCSASGCSREAQVIADNLVELSSTSAVISKT
jgi:hypothetical protein